jgi:hypothetical protein
VRITLFVVVVAVHLLVIWLLMPSRRPELAAHEEELTLVPIAMLPEPVESQPRPLTSFHSVPARHAGSANVPRARPPAALETSPAPPSSTEAPSAPDWRAQAEITAQSSAQHIVAAEDDARRRANALTAPYKPMPGPRVRGTGFGWDPAPKHRFTAIGHGSFVFPLNDRCSIVVIIFPWFGCSLGPKPAANGDLFKYMHGPVKFGDWDWRVQDP